MRGGGLLVMLVVVAASHNGWKVAEQPHAAAGSRGNMAEQATGQGSGWLLMGVSGGGGAGHVLVAVPVEVGSIAGG